MIRRINRINPATKRGKLISPLSHRLSSVNEHHKVYIIYIYTHTHIYINIYTYIYNRIVLLHILFYLKIVSPIDFGVNKICTESMACVCEN